ncbi:G5 domain protein [Streptococcus mitis]|uniref:G5 domain protein n=1 Tax=Streptococcus mitis TaxID=28037 RepID=A0A081QVI2_STRMT|nr:G5 domain-containing protein [Streptococcus mitis]KEQ46955.1 G5 domain protein [Streptococcus mitis]
MKLKDKFNADERRRKFSLRKISGIGAVSAVIGIIGFSSLPLGTVSATEPDITVNYKYATTDELTETEKELIVNELPNNLVDGSDLFVIYRKDNANNTLPNTGSNVLPLASVVGTGLLLVAFIIKKTGKADKKIVKSILSISLVGGVLTVTTVSALTVATLSNYNHTETISAGATFPDGRVNISGYHFVGYIDGKDVVTNSTTTVTPLPSQRNTMKDTINSTDKPEKDDIDDSSRGKVDPVEPIIPPKEDESVKPVDPKVIDKIIKVDDSGNALEDVTGYTKVSTSQPVETREFRDGQLIIIRTVTEVYKKDTVSEEKTITDLLKEANVVIPSTLVEILSEEVVEDETPVTTTPTATSTPVKPTVEKNEKMENTGTASSTGSSVGEDKKEEIPAPVEASSSSLKTIAEPTIVKAKKVIRTMRTTEDIPFEVVVKKDSSLAEGETKVETEGKLGKKVSIQKITLVDNVETVKETISETREEPQNKVVLVGTKKTATQVTTSEVVPSASSATTLGDESKATTQKTPIPGYYTVEVTESENKTVVTDREKVRELAKDRSPLLNLIAPDGEKLVQVKTIEVYDNTILAGQRQLQDIQASYVTVNIKKKRDLSNKEQQTELVITKEIPLITKVYHIGTKPNGLSRKDVVVSGHAFDSKSNAIEEKSVSIYKDNKLVAETNTDFDGYMFTHLITNQSYTLKSDGFEAKITPLPYGDPIIENIKGHFELGRKYSDDMIDYHLKSKVIYVNDGQYQSESDNGKKVVLSKEIDARVGDILIIPPSKIYETSKAIKINSISTINNQSVIEYSVPSLYEVVQNINTKAWSSSINRATFIPAEGVTVKKASNTDQGLFRSVSLEGSLPIVSIPLLSKDNIKGTLSFNISGKVWSDAVDLNFWIPKIDFMNFDINKELSFTTEGSLEFSTSKNIKSLEIPLGELILPTPVTGVTVNIPISIKTTVEGSLTVSVSSTYSIQNSIKLQNWVPEYKRTVNHTMKVGEVKAKATVQSGPEIKVKPKILGIDTVSLSANAGLGIESSYSKTNLSVGEKTEDKTNLITGNNEKLITSPISVNDKKISIETYGYLTLKAELEILKQAKKLGLIREDMALNDELTLFDGKLKGTIYERDLGSDYSSEPVRNPEAIFGKLTKPFFFGPTGRGRFTGMVISKDGNIMGNFRDPNWLNTGPNHPNGQVYVSNFTGKFNNLVKVNEYEYKMILTDLDYPKAGETKIFKGVRIDTLEPYGIADSHSPGKEFILYLPGRLVKDLPEIVRDKIRYAKDGIVERLTRAVIFNKDKRTVFVESDSPIRKVSVEDELIIKEIIDNGYAYQFSKLVKSKPVMNAYSLYVRQFNPGELIDYYNTYKGDKTYQLEDVIKALPTPAKKVSVPLKYYTEKQWRKLANDKKSWVEWFYSQADKVFYEVAKGGRGGGFSPLRIEPSYRWKVSDNGIEVKTYLDDGVDTPYQKYLLKKNNKKYDGGINKTPYYISRVTRL